MSVRELDGILYSAMVRTGAEYLRQNSEEVNDLNVFPIPDGDTGSNMCLTIDGGASAITEETENISDASRIVADGMLMGARGNSGVILSQFFAGIAKGLDGIEKADAAAFAKALDSGVKSAYASVVTPTEGTILTVAREASEYANKNLTDNSDIDSIVRDFIVQAEDTLARTPEMLDVLKQAGVVDSGGAGLIYIFKGIARALGGDYAESTAHMSTGTVTSKLDLSRFDENTEMTFGYCTECMLRLQHKKTNLDTFDINEFIAKLSELGNSIVAFRTGTIVKIHIHTLTPGVVLNFCQNYGEFLTMKVENMQLQHNNLAVTEKAEEVKPEPQKKKERTRYALVAVCNGEGLRDAFIERGTDYVIDGGQCMNPSAKDFIEAFDDVNADRIIVLPNNSNIVLTAKQAAGLYEASEVYVLESKTIGEGYAALSMYDTTSDDIEMIMDDLKMAMDGVNTILVSKAVRDANVSGVEVSEGEYISICKSNIVASSKDKIESLVNALKEKVNDETGIIILIRGKDSTEAEMSSAVSRITAEIPSAEVYEIDGKQDIYDFIAITE